MARLVISFVLGSSAILLSIATAVLIFILATSIIFNGEESCVLVLASGGVQTLSCLALTILLIWEYRSAKSSTLPSQSQVEPSRRRYLPLLTLGILPSLAAITVNGCALGWSLAKVASRNFHVLGLQFWAFLTYILAVWGVAFLAQFLYFASLIWLLRKQAKGREQHNDAINQMQESSRPATANTVRSNPFRDTRLPSHTPTASDPFQTRPSTPPSMAPSEDGSSLRSSFSTIKRPGSSKRGLLTRQQSFTHRSQRSSIDVPSRRPSQDSAFDSWDTSSVSIQMRETLSPTKPLMKKPSPLAPIPGSRSPSPAKALEGPFFSPSPETTPPASPLAQPRVFQSASAPPTPNPNSKTPPSPHVTAVPPPTDPTTTTTSRNFSRRGSLRTTPPTTANENHIHPLFRTNSPVPPPSASHGTILTAAPEAGQLINDTILRRMRSRSGSTTSNGGIALVRSESSPDVRAVDRARLKLERGEEENILGPLEAIGGRGRHVRKRSASFEGVIGGAVEGGRGGGGEVLI